MLIIFIIIVTLVCLLIGFYINHRLNENAIVQAGKICKWVYAMKNKKICITGGASCWGAKLSMSVTGTLGNCDGKTITISNITGNIGGVDIHEHKWDITQEWDGTTLTFKSYKGDGHRRMWTSNNDGKGFGFYPVSGIPGKSGVTISNIGISGDTPPKMSVGVTGLPLDLSIECNSENPLTLC